MAPLIHQLQSDAADGSKSLPDVLRKARIVAIKLKVTSVGDWLQHELHGYPEGTEVPKYRVLVGDLRVPNPVNGVWMPIEFKDIEYGKALARAAVGQSIGSLFEVVNSNESDYLHMPLPPEVVRDLLDGAERGRYYSQVIRRLQKAQILGIFDAVRSQILEWSLELEQQGIVGDGLTFTEAEQKKAEHMTIHIGTVSNMTGVIGNAAQAVITNNDADAWVKVLSEKGISAEETATFRSLANEHRTASPETKLQIAAKIADWTVRNAPNLGALAALVRSTFGI